MDGKVEIDLGGIELSCDTSLLDVQLSCLAHFSVPENESNMITREQLITSFSATAAAERPWVMRGTNFRLVISLSTHLDLQRGESDELGNLLASSLWQTEIWKRLGLSPSSVRNTCSEGDGIDTVTVFIDYPQHSHKPSGRILHRLGKDVPSQDLKPPDGITTILVDDICIAVHVERQNFNVDTSCKDATLPWDGDKDASMRTTQPRDESPALGRCPPTRLDSGFYTNESDDEDLLDIIADEETRFAGDGTTSDDANQGEHDFEELDYENFSTPSYVSAQYHNLPRQLHDHAINAQGILSAVDIALRYAFFESPFRQSPSILVKRDAMTQKLAVIMPLIFSSGYLAAVSSRVVLTPTISHVLAKFGRLQVNLTNSHIENDSSDVPRCPPIPPSQATLSTMLWQKLQSRLYDPRASRRLKSFLSLKSVQEMDTSTRDELLDPDTLPCYDFEALEHENDDLNDDLNEDLFVPYALSNEFIQHPDPHPPGSACHHPLDSESLSPCGVTQVDRAAGTSHIINHHPSKNDFEDNMLDQNNLLLLQDDSFSVCGYLGCKGCDNDDENKLVAWESNEDDCLLDDQSLDVNINPSSHVFSDDALNPLQC